MRLQALFAFIFSLFVICYSGNDNNNNEVEPLFDSWDKSTWIDPGDMFQKKSVAGKTAQQSQIGQKTHPDVKSPADNQTNKEEIVSIYYSRYVKHLLYLLSYDEQQDEISYQANFVITREQIKFLKKFVNSDNWTTGTIVDVNSILSQIISNINSDVPGKHVEITPDTLFQSQYFKYGALACIVMWICGNPLGARTVKSRIFILFLFGTGLALIHTWERMIQETEAANRFQMSTQYGEPIECRPHEMSGWQTFTSFWKINFFRMDNPCESYHKILHIDPKLRVNMVKAFIEMVSDMLMHAIERISECFGRAIANVTKGMPWYMSMLFGPLALLFILLNFNHVFIWLKSLLGLFTKQPPIMRDAIEDLDNASHQQLPASQPQVIYLVPQISTYPVQLPQQQDEVKENLPPSKRSKDATCNEELVQPKYSTIETQTELDSANDFEILSGDDVLVPSD